jgi:hypothetical protein
MKTILNLSTLTFVMVIVSSCNKEISENNFLDKDVLKTKSEKLKIDPYYEFADLDAYDKAFDMIIESNIYSADLLFKSDGFKSYAAIYKEFAEKAHSKLSEKEYENLLEEYSDIIRIEDDVIYPRIDDPLIRTFVNRQGIVKVGTHIYLYGEREKLISVNGSLDDLILAIESPNIEIDGVYRFDYQIKSYNILAACGSYQENVITHNNNRRARIICTVYNDWAKISQVGRDGQGTYRFRTLARTEGIPYKKNIWGNWVVYKTINELDLRYRAQNNLYQNTLITYYQKDTKEDIGIVHYGLIGQEGNGCWNEQGNYQGTFEWINKNRYTHRGLENNWVEIQCGFY